ncbi:MAG: 50S ribosomal protein L9 [Bacilli bacterium]|nr:50S ribosomal protein L9 [Bacilli bacterium]
MRVILLEDVKKQGKKNDIITVKDGYGMFLINNKLAVKETKGSSLVLQKQNEEALLKENLVIKDCESIKEKLEKMTISFTVNTGKDGQVFGQVSTKQIASSLKEKGFDIDKRKIKLDVPINTLGVTNVTIILHKKVEATLKVRLKKAGD